MTQTWAGVLRHFNPLRLVVDVVDSVVGVVVVVVDDVLNNELEVFRLKAK